MNRNLFVKSESLQFVASISKAVKFYWKLTVWLMSSFHVAEWDWTEIFTLLWIIIRLKFYFSLTEHKNQLKSSCSILKQSFLIREITHYKVRNLDSSLIGIDFYSLNTMRNYYLVNLYRTSSEWIQVIFFTKWEIGHDKFTK